MNKFLIKKVTLAAFVGLMVLVGFMIGASSYGFGLVDTYTAATETITVGVTTADDASYVFSAPMRHAYVQNHPSATANLYIKINCTDGADGIDVDDYDIVLEPGQMWSGYQDSNLLISGFCIYADAAATYGTDFVVKGVD